MFCGKEEESFGIKQQLIYRQYHAHALCTVWDTALRRVVPSQTPPFVFDYTQMHVQQKHGVATGLLS